MLRGVPLPQCIAHACRDMQKHVWTCICLQLFLNCIEKLSTNTALCISQRQPHTQLAPTTCHSFCFCLAFLSSGSLALLCGRPADRPNDMHAICLSAPGEFPIPICPTSPYPWHPRYMHDLLALPCFQLPASCNISRNSRIIYFFYHIPPAAFLFHATLKFYKCR